MRLIRLAQSSVQLVNDADQALLFDPGSYNLDHDILSQPDLLR